MRRLNDISQLNAYWDEKSVIFVDDATGRVMDVIFDDERNERFLEVAVPYGRDFAESIKDVLIPTELIFDEDEDYIYVAISSDEALDLPAVKRYQKISEDLVERTYKDLQNIGIEVHMSPRGRIRRY